MCINEKICFQTPTFKECNCCDKLNELVKSQIIMSSSHFNHYIFCVDIAILKSFNKDLNTPMYTMKETILDFFKEKNNHNYCYKDYIDILYVKICDNLWIKSNDASINEYIDLSIFALLILFYGEINDDYNDLYQMYLETHPKPKSLESLQIRDKYVGKTAYLTKTIGRRGQSELREVFLEYDCRCKLCGASIPELLILSHSKPWNDKNSNALEKLDVFNVFLLCPNHDKAYDKGYISFNDDGTILISPTLDEFNKRLLNINENMKIDLEEGHLKYLTYHRENIFQK